MYFLSLPNKVDLYLCSSLQLLIKLFVALLGFYCLYCSITRLFRRRTFRSIVFQLASSLETLCFFLLDLFTLSVITPEQVPIQYGGLSVDFCECNPEFTVDDPATEITVKPTTKQTVEIIVNEKCIIAWELRVVGWEVSYSAEYVPNTEGCYTVIIQKTRTMAPIGEPVISNSFKISELGKILLTVDNPTAKKKKLLYRFKAKDLADPFSYDAYIEKQKQEKLEAKCASRITLNRRLLKVNWKLGKGLLEEEEIQNEKKNADGDDALKTSDVKKKSKKRKGLTPDILKDERFSEMFENKDVEIDELSPGH